MSAVVEPTPEDGRLLVRPPSLAQRRPVLSFLAVLGIVCLVLAGVGRSGVAAPQVRMRSTSHRHAASGCTVTYELLNDGLRPVEVEAASWASFTPFTIPGGTRREVGHAYPCADLNPPDAEVQVRSIDLGLRRTIRPEY